jgi:hypothetical protein
MARTRNQLSTPSDGKGNAATIWVAIIGALGVVLAAALPLLHSTDHHQSAFSGRVEQSSDHAGIDRAKVIITADQQPAQIYYTDSEGTFNAEVPKDAKAITVEVQAKGFAPSSRNIGSERFGLILFDLTKVDLTKQDASPDGTSASRTTVIQNEGNGNTFQVGDGNQAKSAKGNR